MLQSYATKIHSFVTFLYCGYVPIAGQLSTLCLCYRMECFVAAFLLTHINVRSHAYAWCARCMLTIRATHMQIAFVSNAAQRTGNVRRRKK